MSKFFRDILTTADNQTYDIGRVGIASSLLIFFVLSILQTVLNHSFNAMEFAGGAGTILVAGAGNLALKRKSEPQGASNVQ